MKTNMLRIMLLMMVGIAASLMAKDPVNPESRVPPNSKVYIAPSGGFETYLAAAFTKKKVPVSVVTDREKADFEIKFVGESTKVGWARTVFMGQVGTDEEGSLTVTNIKTSVLAFAYAVNKKGSARGKQSAAEACAKHIKEKIEEK
jgi:hypothetical protein